MNKQRNSLIVSVSAMGLFALGTSLSHADEISSQLINVQTPITTSVGLSSHALSAATSTAPVAAAEAATAAAMNNNLLPPNATPGQCFARIWERPKFQTSTETVETKPIGERVEVIPATYETVTEQVLVKEASEKLISVPATYETVSEKILVNDTETHWHYGKNGIASAKRQAAGHPDAAMLNYARSLGMADDVQPGQCYVEYTQPAKYDNVTEQMVKSEASQKINVIPAQYEVVEEKVLVSEASEKLITIPATYETVTEKVLVEPAYTTWKVSECSGGACEIGNVPNRVPGSLDRIDHSTGEIMCLVEVPAKYKTISKRVLKTPATTKTVTTPAQYKFQKVTKLKSPASQNAVDIPATYQTVTKKVKVSEPKTGWYLTGSNQAAGKATGNALCMSEKPAVYKTVTRQVVKTPATTRSVEIPAVYKTVEVRKMTTAPQERRIEIPAEFGQVTKTEKVSEGSMDWRPVLCQANMTRGKIEEIQTALKDKGSYFGPVDGLVGAQTINALQKFQKQKGLTVTRYMTIESVKALGVNPTH